MVWAGFFEVMHWLCRTLFFTLNLLQNYFASLVLRWELTDSVAYLSPFPPSSPFTRRCLEAIPSSPSLIPFYACDGACRVGGCGGGRPVFVQCLTGKDKARVYQTLAQARISVERTCLHSLISDSNYVRTWVLLGWVFVSFCVISCASAISSRKGFPR